MCEVAVATHTSPSQWWGEELSTLYTVLDILERAEQQASKKK